MFKIGICDDNETDSNKIEKLCTMYLKQNKIEYQFEYFSSGEDLMLYCEKEHATRIDLLFLDVEMQGMDGIEAKERAEKNDYVWRIVFVSSHPEAMPMAFGIKTLGFMGKPVELDQITKWIRVVRNDMEENIIINFEGMTEDLRLEQIEYVEGARSYVIIHLHNKEKTKVITRNLKYIEKLLAQLPFVRIHKSYIVNLQHVIRVGTQVELKDNQLKLPVGRVYKEQAVKKYRDYVREKVRNRR